MTLNVDPAATSGTPKRRWTTRSQTPLAQARRRRTYAEQRIMKAQLLVEKARAEFEASSVEVAELEALVAKGVRGLN